MFRSTLLAALIVCAPLPLLAQAPHAAHPAHHAAAAASDHAAHQHAPQGSAHGADRMTTPCPLHLSTLELTPVQEHALTAIRAAHMAEMKAVKARLGASKHEAPSSHAAMHAGPLQEAMTASMSRALDALRATLDDAQRARLEQAVSAHADEKAAHRAQGHEPRCGCCADHSDGHREHAATGSPAH